VRDRDGASQLIVRDPDGTDRELVNRTGARIGDVAFSPDGDHIAFTLEDEQQPGIYLAHTRADQGARGGRQLDMLVAPVRSLDEMARDQAPALEKLKGGLRSSAQARGRRPGFLSGFFASPSHGRNSTLLAPTNTSIPALSARSPSNIGSKARSDA